MNTFNDNSVANEFFNYSQNSFESDDWKKDIEKNIEIITSENNNMLKSFIESELDKNSRIE